MILKLAIYIADSSLELLLYCYSSCCHVKYSSRCYVKAVVAMQKQLRVMTLRYSYTTSQLFQVNLKYKDLFYSSIVGPGLVRRVLGDFNH